MPIYCGKQIYAHTLLRNLLHKDKPAFKDVGNIYRRMNVKKIQPREVYDVLNEELFAKQIELFTSFSDMPKERTETELLSLNYLNNCAFIPKISAFFIWPKPYLETTRFSGERLSKHWNKFTISEKREIIVKLMKMIKQMHDVTFSEFGKFGISNNLLFEKWEDYMSNIIKKRLKQAENLFLLENQEIKNILVFLTKTKSALISSDSRLVHHDIKLDNVVISESELFLIDFEFATAAPIDYELDTLLRYFSDPEIYGGEFCLKNDYFLIKKIIKEIYPELLAHPDVQTRLSVYSLKFYLDLLVMNKKRIYCKKKIRNIINGEFVV